jgi:hypothetical protein
MSKRALYLLGAVALALTVLTGATAGAQEPPDGAPPCPPGETCVDPVPPCPDGEPCADPPPCPDPNGCVDPPPPCPPDGGPCVEPCPDGTCDFDADDDGWDDFIEQEFGSDPNDASSTPEHGYVPETCTDTVDNDGDGATDLADEGCNIDSDADGVLDANDNCPYDPNADQSDADGDGFGDVCDYDADNDGWDDFIENDFGSDPNDANSTPEHTFLPETCSDALDNDGDGLADEADPGCAPDADFDLVPDASDNCPAVYNSDQTDSDGDGTGDACEDSDGDGFFDMDEMYFGSDAADASSTPEHAVVFESCDDVLDNDGDGLTDMDDDGCSFVWEALPPGVDDTATEGDGSPRSNAPGASNQPGASNAPNQPSTAAQQGAETAPSALPSAGTGPGGGSDTWVMLAGLIVTVAGAGALALGARFVRARE